MSAPVPPAPTTPEESRKRIHEALLAARREKNAVHEDELEEAIAGEEVRVRMMHPGAWIPDDPTARPLVYLASLKNDPKVREISTRPEIALLLHESPDGEENSMVTFCPSSDHNKSFTPILL